jgi:hypothetical protein
VNVWQALDRHPFYETLHHVTQPRLGMSTIKDIFALEDEDELWRLLTNAGFQCVEIAIVAAISEDMKEPLLEVAQEDDVVIPFHAFFARAVRPKVPHIAGVAEPKLESSASQKRRGNAITTISPT